MKYASVCILSFNRPEFLQETIASLHANAGYPIEVIVGDDGSEKGVQWSILDMLDEGLISRVVMNPPGHNEGVGAMVNRLFAVATGDVLCKADQDLVYKPGAIAEIVRVLEVNQASNTESLIGTIGGFRYWTDPVDHNEMLIAEHDDWTQVKDYVSSFLAIRRGLWERLGPWEEHSDAFAEDIAFKNRLSAQGFPHALTKEDVLINRGFGVGPSTVVVSGDEENGHTVQAIHHEPKVFSAA